LSEITFDYNYAHEFFNEKDVLAKQEEVTATHAKLHSENSDQTGWVDLPHTYDENELNRIKDAAEKITAHSDVLLVIGIGGSYLGSKAAIDLFQHHFNDLLPEDAKSKLPYIIFAGQTLSEQYIADVKDILKNKDFSINVISKSGATTEPAIALRIFKAMLIDKYGEEAAKDRLFVTTNEHDGALLQLAKENDYETFFIPDDLGGRYSVLTAAGLLPIAVSGINIDEIMSGARTAHDQLQTDALTTNNAYQYAVARNLLYEQSKTVELLVSYEPNMHTLSKWWQQLFGESEGKNNQGIYPAFVNFPTDLHAIGQYIQEGRRDLFETTLKLTKKPESEIITHDQTNIDGLNYLAGKSLADINEKVHEAAVLAHTDGGVPNLIIHVPRLSPYMFGYLVYFFQKACAMSSYLFGVNPFDQPGVEAYKTNMFKLLGKNE